jgi:hypothetical protein
MGGSSLAAEASDSHDRSALATLSASTDDAEFREQGAPPENGLICVNCGDDTGARLVLQRLLPGEDKLS